jgi:hypothetical protein
MTSDDPHKHNGILAALDTNDLEELRPSLRLVELKRGTPLYEPDMPIHQVFFPHSCVVSMVAVMRDGRIAETATLGREGSTGSEAVLGNADTATSRCLVQVSGKASEAPLSALRSLFMQSSHAHR